MLEEKLQFDVKKSLHSCPHLPSPIVDVLGYLARQGANYPPQKGVALCIYLLGGSHGGEGTLQGDP